MWMGSMHARFLTSIDKTCLENLRDTFWIRLTTGPFQDLIPTSEFFGFVGRPLVKKSQWKDEELPRWCRNATIGSEFVTFTEGFKKDAKTWIFPRVLVWSQRKSCKKQAKTSCFWNRSDVRSIVQKMIWIQVFVLLAFSSTFKVPCEAAQLGNHSGHTGSVKVHPWILDMHGF